MGLCKILKGHWWSEAKGWGVRKCRLCSRRERRMYDSESGRHWVLAN